MLNDQVFGIVPTILMQFRAPLTCFPPIFNVTGDCAVGNGSGFNQDAIYSSYAEYIERYHFYYEVDRLKIATLDESNTAKISQKLKYLINQTKNTSASTDTHAFNLTAAHNIFSQESVWLPTVLISLAATQSADRGFIPFADSCGQACHVTAELAFEGALNEFIERQALVGSWLSGTSRYFFRLEPHKNLSKANKIIRELNGHGDLLVFEINNHLPGYSVIIFYFSKSTQDIVRYSVGMASDKNPCTALQKAVNELWQSYMFMYLNTDCHEKLDSRYKYLNELLAFNNHDTKTLIPYFKSDLKTIATQDFIGLPTQDSTDVLLKLKTISDAIFSYQRSRIVLGKRFYFCKILSPDFFIHMGITMPLNLNNNYSSLLNIPTNLKITQPIPFP